MHTVDNYYLAFNRAWFTKHQHKLLWLLNSKWTRRWFKWILCIRKCDVGYDKQIVKLLPNCYTVFNSLTDGKLSLTTDFRTHNKYAKRIYYAFKPIWWAMHYWDYIIGDRIYYPRLSCSLATLTVYPDPDPEVTTVDGWVRHSLPAQTWADKIASAGTGALDTTTTLTMHIQSSTTTDRWDDLRRIITLFNTSSLGAGATIDSATLSLYGQSKVDPLLITHDLNIYSSAPASNTALVSADYSTFGSTAFSTAITYAGWSTTAYNVFSLNASGITNINKTGVSKFGARNANYDVAAIAPTWASGQINVTICYSADETGTSNDPKLVVTYTAPSSLPQSRFISNDVFMASQSKVVSY